MDGGRVRDFWAAEAKAVLATYRHFETLLPSKSKRGASHAAEDGRYVEALLRAYLQKFLPSSIEIFSGFILRPAVKTGKASRERHGDRDAHSRQLDLIVYDSSTYPVYQRFADAAIVPPEGVLAIVSVKKFIGPGDVAKEAEALSEASLLCQCDAPGGGPLRGPFLALIGMGSVIKKAKTLVPRWIFEQLRGAYASPPARGFDETVGYVGAIDSWSIVKSRPSPQDAPELARYVYFAHRKDEAHLTLQHLITGVLGVFYDPSRRSVRRPGFTAFSSDRPPDGVLGQIAVTGFRRPRSKGSPTRRAP